MITSGVSTRHQIGGFNYATSTSGQAQLLNRQGVDAFGRQHLTAGQRTAMMADGYKKASGLGNRIGDAIHRGQASAASAHARATYANAARDGVVTKYEQRQIDSANRDARIAHKQVQVDQARTHLGNVQRNAALDGIITPSERNAINSARGNLNRLSGELNRMKSDDRRMDRADAKFFSNPLNRFQHHVDSAIGRGRPAWPGPATLPQPHVHVGGGGPRIGIGCGGCVGGHLGHIGGGFRLGGGIGFGTGGGVSTGFGRVMGFGEQIGMMARGAAKAQYTASDFNHQLQAHEANARVGQAYANAGGRIGLFDRININSAKRDANIANKQVAYDTQRRHVGQLEQRFAADGIMTPGERFQLGQARAKLGAMGRELNQLRASDRRADARDAAFKANPFNQFRNAISEGGSPFRPMALPRPALPSIGSMIGAAAGAVGSAVSSAIGLGAAVAGGPVGLAAYAASNILSSWNSASGGFSSSFSSTSSWSSGGFASFSTGGSASFAGASVSWGGSANVNFRYY
jgi:hypothetical protein